MSVRHSLKLCGNSAIPRSRSITADMCGKSRVGRPWCHSYEMIAQAMVNYSETCSLRTPIVRSKFVRKRQVSAQWRDGMVVRCRYKMNGSLQKLSTNETCLPNRASVKNKFYCTGANWKCSKYLVSVLITNEY